jgi:mono/diheme cytochrome c family protein
MTSSKIGLFFLLAGALLCPVLWAAGLGQSASSKPTSALTERQFQGEGLFLQNCSFCHFPHKMSSQSTVTGNEDNAKSTVPGRTIGPDLKGLLRSNTMSDQAARTIIQKGYPSQMPGFRDSLDSKEIDSIIDYMKTL